MQPKVNILFIEDEQNILTFVTKLLYGHNYKVTTAITGTEGLQLINSICPDLILLDLGLPDMDGQTIIRQVREWSDCPIIVISARTNEHEKVKALDLGADDYMTKPFGIMELISRVKALLRRSGAGEEKEKILKQGKVVLDRERHMVFVGDTPCELTYKEYELLKLLMLNAGIVTTREVILDRIWGTDFEGESRTLDMHIKTLRQKLGEAGSMIKTVRNVGYILNE